MRWILCTLWLGCCFAQNSDISGLRIRAHTRFLASDLLEGRGVGSRGGDLATEYLAAQLALAGAKPAGDNGTWFQAVPLVGVTTAEDATLALGNNPPLEFAKDWVGVNQKQTPLEDFEASCVFVGHGISAPEFDWNDYKNVDLHGKVAVFFTNEPASEDPKFFGGRALTYYGRWTYKFEEATRRGAVAALIVHTTPTAGYGWEVVRNSWSKEDPQVKVAPGAGALALAGWLSREAGERLFRAKGSSVEEMLQAAESRSFQPVELGVRIKLHLPTKVRNIASRNVAGVIAGSEEGEYVVYTAHWDHLGIGTPVNGDAIYNGAVDNATGCAVVLEIAQAWGALAARPRRSALFLLVTAEEAGLRGSEYYARFPLVPPGKTAMNINYDALYPFGRTSDVVILGAERLTVFPKIQEAARRLRLGISPDARPEQGSIYRSDNFSLSKVGIPAISIKTGSRFAGKPADFGSKIFRDYNSERYHQPSDEYREDWDFTGLEDAARLGFMVGISVANQSAMPSWKPGDEFLPARERSMRPATSSQ